MAFSAFTFKSASFTLKSLLELLGTFTLKTRNTVACENTGGLLDLLNMKTRSENTFTCENGLDLLRIQSGRTTSTHGGRGRTTAHGRGCQDLLNRNLTFFAMRKTEGLRERLDMGFFALRSRKTSSTDGGRGRTTAHGRERHGLLNMHFKSTGSRKGVRELLAMRFKNLESRRGLRGSGMGLLARGFFTFKSENDHRRMAWA